MDYQNVTLSLPKEILRKAKHIAIKRHTSLSALLAGTLEEIVNNEDMYEQSKNRQLLVMEQGFDLGIGGKVPWSRDDLHER